MPQLSTVYISLIYLWTWLALLLLMKTTKTLLMNKTPANTSSHTPTPKLVMPWM